FGCSYLVVSPEHNLITNYKSEIQNYNHVEKYINKAKNKSDLDRTDLAKEKTGVELKGIKAINPVNNEEISIWIADYVLASYGTGAIMAVPAHDERDFEFAKKFNLEIKPVVIPEKLVKGDIYVGHGININSDFLNTLKTIEAKKKIIKWLEKNNLGEKAINYKLRDWVFSRQHYWGEPIPIIKCEKCGNVAIKEKDLPLELPAVKNYQPSKTGESPLAKIDRWVNIKCPKCGNKAKRETDTMPNWAGSSWYYLRYLDPKNNNKFVDEKKIRYWMPVDLYNGGMEHTTLHLLYSRFWHKFLFDLGFVNTTEPYKARRSQGMILAEDGQKMSKSRGNVVSPDDIIKKYGADTLRLYEMFIGPYDEAIPWKISGIIGIKRFLQKIWQAREKVNQKQSNGGQKIEKLFHQTIKKITEDIENLKFNTAISKLMILLNEMEKEKSISIIHYSKFLILLSPFAPHIAEELWKLSGNKKSIHLAKWPEYNKELAKQENAVLIIQVNGKVRDKIEIESGIAEKEIKDIILNRKKIKKYTENKQIKKIIFIKGKLANIVI
ncbi:MAG: leucine--tRNA ligase, partial [Patescibacteria group bacterium]|nr:leucine--tRNA ligase [Patescibacteria group bacterium]